MAYVDDRVQAAVDVHHRTLEQQPATRAVLDEQEPDRTVRELYLVPDVQALPTAHRAYAAGSVTLAIPAGDPLLAPVDGEYPVVPPGLEEMLERRGPAVLVGDGHVTVPGGSPGPPGEVELQARRVRSKGHVPGRHRLDDLPGQRAAAGPVGGAQLGGETDVALLCPGGEDREPVDGVARRVDPEAEDDRRRGRIRPVQVEDEPVEEPLGQIRDARSHQLVMEALHQPSGRCPRGGGSPAARWAASRNDRTSAGSA